MLFRNLASDPEFKKKITQIIHKGRWPHALMFSSREGGGALAHALATATYLVCRHRTEADACGSCNDCVKALHAVHPDIKFYFPAESQPEGEVEFSQETYQAFRNAIIKNPYMTAADWKEYLLKELEAKNKQLQIYKNQVVLIHRDARLKPLQAPMNILLIWLPELFHYGAIPKLLKILEEPPEKTLFLLATEDLIQILPTILSRVQILRIPPIKDVDLVAFLHNQNMPESHNFKRLGEIVNICDGNISMALQLLTEEENLSFFPIFQNWMRGCYSFSLPEIFSFIQQVEKWPREQQKSFVLFSLHLFREAANEKSKTRNLAKVQPHEAAWIKKFEPAIDWILINKARERLEKVVYYLERNANPKIVFLNLSLEIAMEFRQVAKRRTELV